jgi:type II secretion system protein J
MKTRRLHSTLRFRQRGPGFTILEIMIAMSIFMAVLAAIYSSWSTIIRSSKVGMEAAVRVQRSRITMRSLVDSLLCIQNFGANQFYYSFNAESQNEFSYLSFVARLPASFPDAGLFGDQVVRRVTFSVEGNADRQNQLVMYQTPLLAELSEEQKPISVVLAKDVNTFLLEYWNTNKNDWDTEWLSTNQLPKLVRISLGTGHADNYRSNPEDVITRVIALPAIVVPRQYQIGTAAGPGATNRNGLNPITRGNNLGVPRAGGIP